MAKRGPLERRAVRVVDRACSPQPRPPEPRGGIEARVGFVDVTRCGQAVGPGQRAVHLFARPEDVPGAHPAALDAQRHVGLQPEGLTRARGVGRMTIAIGQRPRRRRAAVVEHRLADELDFDLTVDACRRAHQDVLSIIVGRGSGVRRDRVFALPWSHRQRVAHDDPAARRVPRCRHDVRARLVRARRRDVDAERTQPEVSRLAIEQRPEHAGRIEARHTQPPDATVGRDQRTRVAVGEECVVLDRRKRRWHRRTLSARVPWTYS